MDSGLCPVCAVEFDGIEVLKRGQGEGPHLCLLSCGHEVVAMFPRGGGIELRATSGADSRAGVFGRP
jgi:hypothetical protein